MALPAANRACTIVFFVVCLPLLVTPTEVAVMHYGHFGGLSLTCKRDELILMESEVLGYSTNRGCAPQPQCAVPYTLAKWYCRGKSTCGGMQVERRPLHKRTCGSEFTNCLRVEYQCVPVSKLTDICSDALYEAEDGYIRSPSFPEMYPGDKNCSCALSTESGQHVQIDTAFFLLKSNTPCRDWLKINADNDADTTKCGYIPEQRRFIGHKVNINFVSDKQDTEMGFWLKFSGAGGGNVKVRCGRYFNTDVKVTPTTVTPKPTTQTPTTTKKSSTTTTANSTPSVSTDTTESTLAASSISGITTDIESTTFAMSVDPDTMPEVLPATTIDTNSIETSSTNSPQQASESVETIHADIPETETKVAPEEEEEQMIITEDLITPASKTTDLPSTPVYGTEKRRPLPEETVHDMGLGSFPVTVLPTTDIYTEEASTVEDQNTKGTVPSVASPEENGIPDKGDFILSTEPTKGHFVPDEIVITGEDNFVLPKDKSDIIKDVKTEQSDEFESIDRVEGFSDENMISIEALTATPTQETPDVVSSKEIDMGVLLESQNSIDDQKQPGAIPNGQLLLPVGEGEDVLWTSPEYVDLDEDYADYIEPVEVIDDPDTSSTTEMPISTTVSSITSSTKVNEESTMRDITSTLSGVELGGTTQGQKTPPTPTVTGMVHFVHSEPVLNMETSTVEATEENLNMLINEINEANEGNDIRNIKTTISPTAEDETTNPVRTSENESPTSNFLPDIPDTVLEGDQDETDLGEEEADIVFSKVNFVPTSSTSRPPADDIIEGFKLPGTQVFLPDEPEETTGELVVEPTDYPNTIKDSIETSPEIQSVDKMDFRSVYNKYRTKNEMSTPFDWRESLSKAGFPDFGTTENPDDSTPYEMLHYVPSRGSAIGDSIATGEFHPIGDIISLVDEKDLITTTVSTTSTFPPELVTISGDLINKYQNSDNIRRPATLFPFPLTPPSQTKTPRPPPTPAAEKPITNYKPTPDPDLASQNTKWRSIGFNRSWVPHIVPAETPGNIPPFGGTEKPPPEPPKVVPVAVKDSGGHKDLMWVLIVIAIVLWVVFVALLTLLIYHRRRRLACLRGEDPAAAAAAARNDPRSPYSRNLLLPSLSAPMTPATSRHQHMLNHAKPPQAEHGTQTANSRLSSALSTVSASSLQSNNINGNGGGGTSATQQRRATVSGGQSLRNPQGAEWSTAHPQSTMTPSIIRRQCPTPTLVTFDMSTAASTQTPPRSKRRPQRSSAAQTDMSGSIKSRRGSLHSNKPIKKRAPTPPSLTLLGGGGATAASYANNMNQNLEQHQQQMWANEQNRLNHVKPQHYVHTLMRAGPRGNNQYNANDNTEGYPTTGGSAQQEPRRPKKKQPPYAESTTDLTKADEDEEDIESEWGAAQRALQVNHRNGGDSSVRGHTPVCKTKMPAFNHHSMPNTVQVGSKNRQILPQMPGGQGNIINTTSSSARNSAASLPFPPPPSDCNSQSSPASTLRSVRRASIGQRGGVITIKPRARADSNASYRSRAMSSSNGRSRTASISNRLQLNPGYLSDSTSSLASGLSVVTMFNCNTPSLAALNGSIRDDTSLRSYIQENTPPATLRETNGTRSKPPVITFPPPPPPLPPTPPPLPIRPPILKNAPASQNEACGERTLPVGCEAPTETRTPTMTRVNSTHDLSNALPRGKSVPDVTNLNSSMEANSIDDANFLRIESAPHLAKEMPAEKLKGLVPQQAFFFNDKVQPELRRILSKRRFGNLPVQV